MFQSCCIILFVQPNTEDLLSMRKWKWSSNKTCLEIAKRFQVHFLEIGTDGDHVHFLIQSVPMYSPTKIARMVKSITARQVFQQVPEVKKQLWGGEFWTDGYYISSVGRAGSENAVKQYVKNQGTEQVYQKIHHDQLVLF